MEIMVDFSNIQGNILKGFNKPYNTFIFFKFKNDDNRRSWLKSIGKQLCSHKANNRCFN